MAGQKVGGNAAGVERCEWRVGPRDAVGRAATDRDVRGEAKAKVESGSMAELRRAYDGLGLTRRLLPLTALHTHPRRLSHTPMHGVQACRPSWKVALGEQCRPATPKDDSGHARRVRRLNSALPGTGERRRSMPQSYHQGTFATNRGYGCDKPQARCTIVLMRHLMAW
ncbi:hypothetical protein Q7P37_008191 [Cladosporium fusiforme]